MKKYKIKKINVEFALTIQKGQFASAAHIVIVFRSLI